MLSASFTLARAEANAIRRLLIIALFELDSRPIEDCMIFSQASKVKIPSLSKNAL